MCICVHFIHPWAASESNYQSSTDDEEDNDGGLINDAASEASTATFDRDHPAAPSPSVSEFSEARSLGLDDMELPSPIPIPTPPPPPPPRYSSLESLNSSSSSSLLPYIANSPAPPSISPPPSVSPSVFEPPSPIYLRQVPPPIRIEQRSQSTPIQTSGQSTPLRIGIEFYYAHPLGAQELIEKFPASIIFLDQQRMHWFNTYVAFRKRGQHIQEYLDRALE